MIKKRKVYEELHKQFTKEDKENKTEGELAVLNNYLKEYRILEGILNDNLAELEKHFNRLDNTLNNIGSTLGRLENLEDKSFDKVDFIARALGF